MRRAAMLATLAIGLAGCGGSGATGSGGSEGDLAVQRATLRPGAIELSVHNGTARAATLAQVAVDSGFVGFAGPPMSIAAHADATLSIPYPVVPGEAYSVKVLTGDGQTFDYRASPG
jgi:hypothetical protein